MSDSPHKPAEKLSRRGFLIMLTGSALAAAAGCRPQDMPPVPTLYAPGSDIQPPNPASTGEPTAAASVGTFRDPRFGEIIYDQTLLTEVKDLYITQYDYGNTPEVDPTTWSLTVDGLVESPLTLNLEAIKALPAHEDMRVLECISDPVGGNLIGNLMWKGVLFQEILKQVKPKPEATFVRFYAADGYSTSVKVEWITQPMTLLAYEMNGEPLTVPHGFPLRIHMPGLYGQKMPRWLTRIEFIDFDYTGYWEGRGWSNIAAIKTRSMVRLPDAGGEVKPGAIVVIQGLAFAGKRDITQVEVQIDGGEWMPATLKTPKDPLSWTQWYLEWTIPAPGSYQIGVRATDSEGFTQESESTGIFGGAFPNGTDAIHRTIITGVEG